MTEPLSAGRDRREIDAFDVHLTLKGASEETGGRFSVWEGIWHPGGFAPVPHIHREEHESFYVLEGVFDFLVGEATIRAEPGRMLHVPPGTLHGFVNAGDEPARLIFVHAPPLVGFFYELEELSRSGAKDLEAVAGVMRRWGMQADPTRTVRPADGERRA
jgi:mannose-6-phosphate isomerase-like protein (cupin superfamily)